MSFFGETIVCASLFWLVVVGIDISSSLRVLSGREDTDEGDEEDDDEEKEAA